MTDDPLEHIVVKSVRSASLEDLIDLYKDAGWWKPAYENNLDFLSGIVKQSAIFVGAHDNGKLIGMGRALSDMVSDAYIQDIAVRKAYRQKGIGARIVKTIVDLLQKQGVDWIGLVGQPGTSSFYKDIGFEELKDHTPYRYKG